MARNIILFYDKVNLKSKLFFYSLKYVLTNPPRRNLKNAIFSNSLKYNGKGLEILCPRQLIAIMLDMSCFKRNYRLGIFYHHASFA